ncbi:MAG: glycosyltransferase family 39 protein, partial [Burkholderiales bacterium]|nr:glycosyltransferase family 39 protein [Anaerolineae bacterium]
MTERRISLSERIVEILALVSAAGIFVGLTRMFLRRQRQRPFDDIGVGVNYPVSAPVFERPVQVMPPQAASLAPVMMPMVSASAAVPAYERPVQAMPPQAAPKPAPIPKPLPVPVRRQPRALTGMRARTSADSRRRAAQVFTFVAIVLAIMSAYQFRPTEFGAPSYVSEGVLFMLLSFGAGAAALWLRPAVMQWPALSWHSVQPANSQWLTTIGGAAMLLILAEINGHILGVEALQSMSPHVQFGLLVGGTLLVAWGLSGLDFSMARYWITHLRRRDVLIVGGLTLFALVLRLWNLQDGLRVFIHEEIFLFTSYRFLWDPLKLLELADYTIPQPLLFSYWQHMSLQIFGYSLWSFRLPHALFGAAIIPATYILGKHLFNRRVALIAALILATFPPHLHLSRYGLPTMPDALFGTLALGLLAGGLRTNRRAYFAFGGVFLGMTNYFWEAGRLLFTPLAVLWLIGVVVLTFWDSWRRGQGMRGTSQQVSQYLPGLLVAAVATILVAMPIYYTMRGNEVPIAMRYNANGATIDWVKGMLAEGRSSELLQMVTEPFLFLVNLTDRPSIIWYYGGTHPLLLEATVPLFLLGVGFGLWRLRKPGALLLLIWCGATLAGNSLVHPQVVSTRYVVMMPAIALLMSIGIVYGLKLLLPRRLRLPGTASEMRWRPALAGALVVLAGAVVIGQGVYYYGTHLNQFEDRYRREFLTCGDTDDAV